MNKLIYLLLFTLALGFFSCNRKAIEFTPKVTYTLPSDTLDVGAIFHPVDTPKVIYRLRYFNDSSSITYDTNLTFRLSMWEPTMDTSDVIIKYVQNWEEGEIETLSGKIVYPNSIFGIWLDINGTSPDTKLYKVKEGIWTPIEWPKDIVELYIRPKNNK